MAQSDLYEASAQRFGDRRGQTRNQPTTGATDPSNGPPALFRGHEASTRAIFPTITCVTHRLWLRFGVWVLNTGGFNGFCELDAAPTAWYFSLERHYTLQIPTSHPTNPAATSHSAFANQPARPATALLAVSRNHVPTTGPFVSLSIVPPSRWGRWGSVGVVFGGGKVE